MQSHAAVSDMEDDESLMIPFECIFLICAADLDSMQSHMDAFYGNCLFPLAGDKTTRVVPPSVLAPRRNTRNFPRFQVKNREVAMSVDATDT